MMKRIRPVLKYSVHVALAMLLTAALPSRADTADDFPSRPMQLIVPVGAGGINDIISRLIGKKLSEVWHQPVVILNRPGAGGIIGTELAAKSAPDGYTMVMVYSSHPVNPALHAKLPYDSVKDFEPITMVNTVDLVLVVNAEGPAKTLKELIALAKEHPGKLNYGTVGTGSLGHLAALVLAQTAAINIVQVPYKSAPEVSTALLGGDVKLFFDSPITALPLLKGGRTRALAVTSATRSSALPDVPTMQEAGLRGYQVVGWNGLLAPAGTPKPIITKLNTRIVEILHSPDVRDMLRAQGVDVVGNSPEEFGKIIRADIAKWGRIVKAAGIHLD